MNKKPTKNGHAKPKGKEKLPTAYFLSLELENVRCFGEKQKLDLSDGNGKPAPWTIILGVNGTGKTTLLQSLAEFNPVVVTTQDGDRAVLPRLFHLAVDDYNRADIASNHSHWWYRIHTGLDLRSTQYWPSITEISRRNKQHRCTSDLPAFYKHFASYAYGAGRRVGELAFLEPSPHDDPTGTLFSDKAKLRNPEEWLIYLDYTSLTKVMSKDVRERQEQIRDQAKKILKSVLWEIDDIRIIPGEGVRPKARVEFKTPYGWVPFRQLGYGYQSLATWVADFASRMVERYPDSENPLAEPAVVLVDEIDLHLHPKWQRELMDRLTGLFPNTQFIATAHSPLIAQAAANANLTVLRREGDHVVIDNDVDYIRNWRVAQILTRDLFGLDSARPPHIAKLLADRDGLLNKPKLTKKDEEQLKKLEAEIGELPYGETKQQREMLDQIQKSLELLKEEGVLAK